jgi:hypothetical protein
MPGKKPVAGGALLFMGYAGTVHGERESFMGVFRAAFMNVSEM